MSWGAWLTWLLLAVALAAAAAVAWLTADGLAALLRLRLAERRRRRESQPLSLVVADRREFTGDLFSVELQGGRRLPGCRPGQYLTLLIEQGNGRTVRRAYSIAQWEPRPRSYWLGIKREAEGLGSAWLHANLTAGAKIRALPPRGNFTLDVGLAAAVEVVLVGGGIGITPMRAMTHALIDAAGRGTSPAGVVLFHAARSAESLVYRDEFERCAAMHPWFRYVPIVSRPDAQWRGEVGRLDAARILAYLHRPASAHCYLCASDAMMQSLMTGLRELGFGPGRLHWESFGLRGGIDVAAWRVEYAPDRAFVYEGQPSLLHALEEHGVDVGADCRAGHCGACRMRVSDGKVRWLLGTPQGLDSNEILACCCVPDSDLKLFASH